MMRRIKVKKTQPLLPHKLVIVIALAVVGFAGFTVVKNVLAQPPGGGGPNIPGLVRYDTAEASDHVTSTATDFEDIPGMSVNFDSSIESSVVAMFSAKIPATSEACASFYRLSIDDTYFSNELPASESGNDATVNFNFVTPIITSGTHIAKIQWRFNPIGGLSCFDDRTLTVLHK